ncbi:hypothetical protein K466DRAFT_584347 [Polyporus arcularius HHB13444]|uniref:Uncharacterized protein n=1 Tax=Polyporus arcularius HHB13444 TaxID=1314778 RepID=A0A5C3PLC1_9APHY|nr:hypothetical protein K466DRAFT_584347 [Polyporus arcularius HHB13444]
MQYWVNTIADLFRPRGLPREKEVDYPFEEDVELGAHEPSNNEDGKSDLSDEDDELPVYRDSKLWTVKNVEGFWSHFLQTRALDANDRTVHEHPRSSSIYYADMPTFLNRPSYGCGVHKRRREDDDDSWSRSPTPPPARRRKIGSPSPPPPPPPSRLRRSRRIQKQHARKQAGT